MVRELVIIGFCISLIVCSFRTLGEHTWPLGLPSSPQSEELLLAVLSRISLVGHNYIFRLSTLTTSHFATFEFLTTKVLFHLTGSIPRHRLILETPRRPDLHKLREQLHYWYFSEQAGGMFLSQEAREAYFSLQNELLTTAAGMTDDDQLIGEHEFRTAEEDRERAATSADSGPWYCGASSPSLDCAAKRASSGWAKC